MLLKTITTFGSKIKDAAVEFGKEILEIVKKDVTRDFAEEP